MADIVDKKTRSRMMAGIKGKNTKPELVLRRALHARGFRFRLHGKEFPGRPDLVFPKHGAVIFVHGCFWHRYLQSSGRSSADIFVHGCFWHRHSNCRYATNPSTRMEFWQGKFDANVARDSANKVALLSLGWRVATVWECALRTPALADAAVDATSSWLVSGELQLEIGQQEVAIETVCSQA